MRKRSAVLIHLNVIRSVTPLTGGYLKAMALTEPEIAARWHIELYSDHVSTPASEIIARLVRSDPDVVGFSVYTWNVRLVQRLLPTLRAVLPRTQFLLGGVEVINLGEHYVDRRSENVAVCNGEGEHILRDFLLQLENERPAIEQVPGLGCWRDGEWISTPPPPRIRDLNSIPSPYLTGVLDLDGVDAALLETNRGCPFACEFCYWGGAIGARVNRFDEARLKEEITYISRKGARTLYICDANFGMLPRDVELAEHLVRTKAEHRYPDHVAFSTAKNSPDRVEQITRILVDGDLMTVQSVSLQTMNPQALDVARRGNIKPETYTRLQRRLNEWGVSSNVELMWPLPGETLESFKDGIDQLCAMGAQAFQVYPLLWINNIGYRDRTEELGVVTLAEDDPAGGGEIVVQTREVTYADYIRGLLFTNAVFLLHDCRGLYVTMQLLHRMGRASFRQVADAFVDWMEQQSEAQDEGLFGHWRSGKQQPETLLQYIWKGVVADAVMHSHREQFDRTLYDFLRAHPEWFTGTVPADTRHGAGAGATNSRAEAENRAANSDVRQPPVAPPGVTELLEAALEFDLLSRPYPFVQTALTVGIDPEHLQVGGKRRGQWTVTSPFDFPAFIEHARGARELEAQAAPGLPVELFDGPATFRIDHRRGQAFRKERSTDDIHWHLYRMLRGIRKTEARYTPARVVAATA